MDDSFDHHLPTELAETAELLRAQRPEMTTFELDRVSTMARQRATRHEGAIARRKGLLMKSRLALSALLSLGILMSGAGATLAISGSSDSGNAGVAQYDDNQGAALGDNNAGGGPSNRGVGPAEQGGTAPTTASEQVSVQGDDGSLPFTGFLAIPLLIGGVALTGTGAVLRRRLARDDR